MGSVETERENVFKDCFLGLFMIIGVTGLICSGKDVVGKVLTERGFRRLSIADEIRETMRRQGLEITRVNMQDFSDKSRKLEGAGFWARRLMSRMIPGADYVIESIRNPAEVEEFRKLDGFFLIGVDAPLMTRFSRMVARDREKDPKTVLEFMALDAKDRGVGQPDHGQQNAKCMDMADIVIINDGTIEDFTVKINHTLEKFKADV